MNCKIQGYKGKYFLRKENNHTFQKLSYVQKAKEEDLLNLPP